MPPPRKAAKKAGKKAVKRAAAHHHGRHHEANELRRASEHMRRVAVLGRISNSSATTGAVAELTTLAQRAIKDGNGKDAAHLLRASEHLSFALLAGEISGVAPGSGKLKEFIKEQFNQLTRSIGQSEEGPVGYSVTNIDGNVVSWRFVELGKLAVTVITSLSDERLLTKSGEIRRGTLKVRAKFWGDFEGVEANSHLDGQTFPPKRVGNSHVWEADMPTPREGNHALKVSFKDAHGRIASDEIRPAVGKRSERNPGERDQDNARQAWPEHGLLGTQLGRNKTGESGDDSDTDCAHRSASDCRR